MLFGRADPHTPKIFAQHPRSGAFHDKVPTGNFLDRQILRSATTALIAKNLIGEGPPAEAELSQTVLPVVQL
jgi:hypothetical protein